MFSQFARPHPPTPSFIHPTTPNLIHPTTSNIIHPTTPNIIHPTTANIIHPTTPNIIHPTTPNIIHPTTPNIILPSSSYSNRFVRIPLLYSTDWTYNPKKKKDVLCFRDNFPPLTFKNPASYIQDGRIATLQMLHFIYFFKQI